MNSKHLQSLTCKSKKSDLRIKKPKKSKTLLFRFSRFLTKQDVWAPAVWAPATETFAVIIPASILSRHYIYFNQSKYYLRSHHFHQLNTCQARIRYFFHSSNFFLSHYRHHFLQQNIHLIRILCMHPVPSSVIL